MPRLGYTKSELYVKDELERLFWIEIAKRKARLLFGDAYSRLVSLRSELEEYFASIAEDVEEPCTDGDAAVFNIVQFGWHVLDRVSDPSHVALIEKAAHKHFEVATDLYNQIPYHQGFYFYDFSLETDLEALHDWWSYITSGIGREDLGTTGHFSTVGEARPIAATEDLTFAGDNEPTIRVGDSVSTITSLQASVSFPRRLSRQRCWVHSTDEAKIVIDGHELRDQLVLHVDLFGPLPSMQKIEAMLVSKQRVAKALRDLALLEQGILPQEEQYTDSENIDTLTALLVEPPGKHKLMKGVTSVRPMIAGFRAWDLVEGGLADSKAAKQVRDELRGVGGAEVFSQPSVIRALKNVRSLVEQYEPSLLPWNT
ncbi:hypothetical protein C4K06_6161 [Pseudomonas chlororaphis subsp. aureofaciens]|uniref:hypothetical protein n=1 Tax=Pseudomonas chlororaphis TaxID=587753 RepID=UPI000F55B0FB|nr:hypothetical protein [Pseudomonas chlororaphis]AZE39149.1 hypothetical protein C4K06_6161 [Pseudomonas chlororaphis subsp. aureofaciens]